MVNVPGAGLHICYPDENGERVAIPVLHGEQCPRCSAFFEIEAGAGATTKKEITDLVRSKKDADEWPIGLELVPDLDARGKQKVDPATGAALMKPRQITVNCKDLKRWYKP